MSKKKRRLNKSAIMILVLSMLVIAGFLFLTTNISFLFKKSIHDDAKRYATKSCLVFYPDSKDGKKIAKEMCKGIKEDTIFDYSLVPYGDNYLVSYGNEYDYFVDKQYNPLVIGEVSDYGKRIIADYLRYTIKKEQPEKYYNAEFVASLNADTINFDEVTYDIYQEYLKCSMPTYDVDVLVPLKYIQKEIGMNFNYMDETYVKPTYIDPNHPVIAFTFDDGPKLWNSPDESSSVRIIDTLYKYDATATFYVVGECLEERDEWTDYQVYTFLSNSITNGNEYGSHTQEHDELNDLSGSAITKVINGPVEFIKDLVGYNMLTYRPPGGSYSDEIIENSPLPAIYWSVDSEDWYCRDAQTIIDNVLSDNLVNGDVVLFHEIYDETAEAMEKLIPYLIDNGYQIVSVEQMFRYFDINLNTLHYFYNYYPKNYE